MPALLTARRSVRPAAFTLIELLVVIAIIAILAAILFPVFAQAREKARASACLSNQKQVGMGLLQYEQDNDEALPASWYIGGGVSSPTGAYKWMDAVYPYVKSEAVFNCPDEDFPFTVTGAEAGTYDKYTYYKNLAAGDKTFRYGSYSINAAYRYDGNAQGPGGLYQKGIAISDIAMPASTIWVADGNVAAVGASGVSSGSTYLFGWSCLTSSTKSSWANCTSTQPQVLKGPNGIINTNITPPEIDHLCPRHQGFSNVIYCDGHSHPVTPDQIAATQITSGKLAGYIGAFIIQNH